MRKSPGATGAPRPAPRTGGHCPATRQEKAGAPLLHDDPQIRLEIGPGRQAVLQGMLAGPAGLDRPRGLAETRCGRGLDHAVRSEEHTSELQSLMRISYAVFCLKQKKNK